MKEKLLFLMAAFIIMISASAQFRIGAKAGTNIVKIDGISFKDQFSYGYHLGGFMHIGLSQNKKISLQPEILFNQYSTTIDSNYKAVYQNVFSANQSRVKLNYLSVPILLNYKIIGPLSLQAGPQFSVLMDQDKTFLQNGADAFKKGDFSLIGGAQIRITKIYITGRYVVGLNNINDIDNKDKWKSQAIQLSVGLSL